MSALAGGGGAVVRQGHLRKLKTMKKKFFVLRGDSAGNSGRLEYYESEKKFKAGAAPRRTLFLKMCYSITRRLDLKQKHVIALFTKEEQFCVVAENEADLHEWLSAILKLHQTNNSSIDELVHPIQHVWQVNVQKKGLGASQNILGLYNLCLTDLTLTLVKIKSQNNVISDLGIPERVEYTLKHIRRCGDSECFFYMEVGRQTATGSGELWMMCDDPNIAQSMHSTIYHAMQNCAKKAENEKDHIMIPNKGDGVLPERRQSYSAGNRGRAGLANVENQPPNNSLTNGKPENSRRVFNHHRTISLPTGYPALQEPLKIVHERTRSAPLTGEELDRAIIEKTAMHSSCKAVNGTEVMKKSQWSRRASTGARLSKLSPAHNKNASTLRNRCDSMPSKATSSFEMDRPIPRLSDLIDGNDTSRDETDSLSDWYRTPRIPEEPDICDIVPKDFISAHPLVSSRAHSRTSSLCGSEGSPPARYLSMTPRAAPRASSTDVCSGTPSSDPRFSEYQLEPARWGGAEGEARPPRAYSVGSRPPGAAPARLEARLRAYSVGARHKPAHHASSLSRKDDDHMELDFSTPVKVIVARTPPTTIGFQDSPRPNVDEYVDMSPRNDIVSPTVTRDATSDISGYVEMKPGDIPPSPASKPPDGYVEMNYTRPPTRPINIAVNTPPAPRPAPAPASPPRRPPLGSGTLFPLSLESPEPPAEQQLSTVRETSEECPRRSPERAEVSHSPQYVKLVPLHDAREKETVPCATVIVPGGNPPARFTLPPSPSPSPAPATPVLHYAALDLETRPNAPSQPTHQVKHYSQIDFRTDKVHAADN